MTQRQLGRLEKVPLREVWSNEASDFTPWLALEQNIALLGDTIGIPLFVEEQEKAVGPFKADILCSEADSDEEHFVLIENQLERTDHTHLGQLLTYAAGLDAATVVWIADRFTDEHRAALDWLNSITSEHFRFFGLEVEAWRIGDSDPAPKFNIVSSPNDWTKATRSGARHGKDSELKSLKMQFWTDVRDALATANIARPNLKVDPSGLHFSTGKSSIYLKPGMRQKVRRAIIRVRFYAEDHDEFSQWLQEREREYEVEGCESQLEIGEKHSTAVFEREGISYRDRDDWEGMQSWFVAALTDLQERFIRLSNEFDSREQ